MLILNELSTFSPFIAGGAVRAWYAIEPIKDIDLFFKSEEQRQKALNYLIGEKEAKLIFSNENVDKVSHKGKVFDFCKKYYDSPR